MPWVSPRPRHRLRAVTPVCHGLLESSLPSQASGWELCQCGTRRTAPKRSEGPVGATDCGGFPGPWGPEPETGICQQEGPGEGGGGACFHGNRRSRPHPLWWPGLSVGGAVLGGPGCLSLAFGLSRPFWVRRFLLPGVGWGGPLPQPLSSGSPSSLVTTCTDPGALAALCPTAQAGAIESRLRGARSSVWGWAGAGQLLGARGQAV